MAAMFNFHRMEKQTDIESGQPQALYPGMVESAELRWAFIRKIYDILTVQLALTAAAAAVVVTVRPISHFFVSSNGGLVFYIVLLILPFISSQTWSIEYDRAKEELLKQMNQAWKGFKSELVTEYVEKNRNAHEMYTWLMPNLCEEFKKLKSTPELKAISQKAMEIQKKNTHPHCLGSGGYAGKQEEWDETLKRRRTQAHHSL